MQLRFKITLNENNELINMANGVDAGRIVLVKFELWLPKMIPKDSLFQYCKHIYERIKMEVFRELYEVSASTRTSGYFQISP